MLRPLWSQTIHGGIGLVTADRLITTPRFGDVWNTGGWWASYDRRSGECHWKRRQRRGATLFDAIGDVMVATTAKYSGVYALSMSSGRLIWYRLGGLFNWLLMLLDELPGLDNVGDGPESVWNGAILTRGGRLLNAKTGRIESRHRLERELQYRSDGSASMQLIRIDGKPVNLPYSAKQRDCFNLYEVDTQPAEALLARRGLERASYGPCVVKAQGMTVMLASSPRRHLKNPGSPYEYGGSRENVQHYLVVSDLACNEIHGQLELGSYFQSEIDWADSAFFAVTTQTSQESSWGYQRQLSVFEWPNAA